MDYKKQQDDIRNKIAAHLGKSPEELLGQLHLVQLTDVLAYVARDYQRLAGAVVSSESVPQILSLFAMIMGILPWIYSVVAKDELIVELRKANKLHDASLINQLSANLANARAEQLMYQITYSLEQAGVPAELIQELRAVAEKTT